MFPILAAFVVLNTQTVDYQLKVQKDEMAKLDFMVGYWEGTITYNNNGTNVVFTGYENRKKIAGGTALLIEAAYTMERDGKQVPAVEFGGIIQFDVKRKKHVRFYQLNNGDKEQVEMTFWDRGYGFEVPLLNGEGKVEYFMNLQADGTFIEIGTIVGGEEEEERVQLMETKLKKVNKK